MVEPDRDFGHPSPVRLAVDIEGRVQAPGWFGREVGRKQGHDDTGAEILQEVSLHIEHIAAPALTGCGIDVVAPHQNWRNSASGRPWRST